MGRSAAARQTAADQFMEAPMLKTNDLSRSVTPFEQGNTLIAVIEMSLPTWLVAGIVPGMERHPLKKLDVDPDALLRLLHRWREEAIKAGCAIERIVIAYEATSPSARGRSRDRRTSKYASLDGAFLTHCEAPAVAVSPLESVT
jgi:hypothetical protein